MDEDLDYRALEDGFVSCNLFVYRLLMNLLSLIADSMVPFGTSGCNYSYVFKSIQLVREVQSLVSNWLAIALADEQ